MNLQNLLAQLGNSTNPMAMMMSLLNPNQKTMINQFQSKSSQEQAEEIAKMCNEKGITGEQLKNIFSIVNKK